VGAWVVAGLTWTLIWFHGTQTHGFTAANEKQLWLASTWMDSSKLLVVPFAALAVGIYLLGQSAALGRITRWLWLLLVVVFAVQAVGVAVGNSPFPWGSYEVTFEELDQPGRISGLVRAGGISQAIGSLLGTVLLIPVGIALVQARRLPWWTVPVAAAGMLFTFFTTPASWVPALAWLLVAAGVSRWRRRPPSPAVQPA
jgi:hypothetical protein